MDIEKVLKGLPKNVASSVKGAYESLIGTMAPDLAMVRAFNRTVLGHDAVLEARSWTHKDWLKRKDKLDPKTLPQDENFYYVPLTMTVSGVNYNMAYKSIDELKKTAKEQANHIIPSVNDHPSGGVEVADHEVSGFTFGVHIEDLDNDEVAIRGIDAIPKGYPELLDTYGVSIGYTADQEENETGAKYKDAEYWWEQKNINIVHLARMLKQRPSIPPDVPKYAKGEAHGAGYDKDETFKCECIECGYKMESEEHCDTLECPECGGKMRREERPGPGKESKLQSSGSGQLSQVDETGNAVPETDPPPALEDTEEKLKGDKKIMPKDETEQKDKVLQDLQTENTDLKSKVSELEGQANTDKVVALEDRVKELEVQLKDAEEANLKLAEANNVLKPKADLYEAGELKVRETLEKDFKETFGDRFPDEEIAKRDSKWLQDLITTVKEQSSFSPSPNEGKDGKKAKPVKDKIIDPVGKFNPETGEFEVEE